MAGRQKASAKWAKFFCAAGLLLPLCAVCTLAAWRLGRAAAIGGQGWRNPLFLSFFGGAAAWCACFAAGLKPVRLYLVGHELTHALWVWVCGGRVTAFRIGPEGGCIQTDRVNFWIALAPYFFPIHSVLALWVWWLAGFWVRLDGYPCVLLAVLGVTWGFHACFTVVMLERFQPDIAGEGWLFSMSLIYLLNLVPLVLLLVMVSPEVGWFDVWRALAGGARDLARVARGVVEWMDLK